MRDPLLLVSILGETSPRMRSLGEITAKTRNGFPYLGIW